MLLYHGTSEAVGRLALKEGLKPRSLTKNSNYKHSAESNPHLIYLTTAYAVYYAINCQAQGNTTIAIVQVDTDLLKKENFRPDEDYIEQTTRENEKLPAREVMVQRTEFVRDRIDDYSDKWELSVKRLGNCAYKGIIPKEAITKVCFTDVAKCPQISYEALQPSIALGNYAFLGDRYRAMVKWFTGDKVNPEDFLNAQEVKIFPKQFKKQQMSFWKEAIAAAKNNVDAPGNYRVAPSQARPKLVLRSANLMRHHAICLNGPLLWRKVYRARRQSRWSV